MAIGADLQHPKLNLRRQQSLLEKCHPSQQAFKATSGEHRKTPTQKNPIQQVANTTDTLKFGGHHLFDTIIFREMWRPTNRLSKKPNNAETETQWPKPAKIGTSGILIEI